MPNEYGPPHHRLRAYWKAIIEAGNLPPCSRCPYPILPTDTWHLDHTDDGTAYLGPAHATCNTRAAANKKNRMYARRPNATPRATRNW